MRTTRNTADDAERAEGGALLAVLANRRLRELDRLRNLGFKQIECLEAAARSTPVAAVFDRMLGSNGQVAQFERVARAIRQITVLEFEIRGLFEAPNREERRLRLVRSDREGFVPPDYEDLFSDLREFERDRDDPRPDYRAGPIEEVVAGVRKALGAEPPIDDPFAPPPKAKAAEPASAPAQPIKLPPATVKLPEKPAKVEPASDQKKLALKAAMRAIKATGGKGFRIPSKRARAQKARAQQHQGRAPP